MLDTVDCHRSPVADVDRALGAGDCDHRSVMQPDAEAATRFDGRSRFVVADETIRHSVRRPIRSAATTDAEMSAAGSTEVLIRAADPLVADLDHRVSIMCGRIARGHPP